MRSDDRTDRTYFRSERVFHADGKWYFSTREGVDMGPYPSRDATERALADFIRDRSREQLGQGAVAPLRRAGAFPEGVAGGSDAATPLLTLKPTSDEAVRHRCGLTARRRS